MPLLHPCCTPVASSSGRASNKNHPFLRFLSQFSDFTRPHFGRKMLFHQENHIPLHFRRIADSPARDPALQVAWATNARSVRSELALFGCSRWPMLMSTRVNPGRGGTLSCCTLLPRHVAKFPAA